MVNTEIKNELRYYNDLVFETPAEELQFARELIELIAVFDKEIKKNCKNLKGSRSSLKGAE